MDDGVLKDFTGAIIQGHEIERPIGGAVPYGAMCSLSCEIDAPVEASLADMRFRKYTWREDNAWCFIICLYNRWGHIIKQWPEGYLPNDNEVREAVAEGLKQEGRRV